MNGRKCAIIFMVCIGALFLFACNSEEKIKADAISAFGPMQPAVFSYVPPLCEIEKQFISDSLVDVRSLDSSIIVQLRYATDSNFTKVNLYGSLGKCYLPMVMAGKLVKAQQALKKINPAYSLLIFDATRPHHIQQLMWDTLKLKNKINYLSHPDSISLHNYGAAVDLTIADADGNELDMGTGFDFFGEKSQPRLEHRLLEEGKLSQQQIANRNILRTAMREGGWWPIPTEWWHFNGANKKWAAANLKLIR